MEHNFFEASKALQEGHHDHKDIEIEMQGENKKKPGEVDENPGEI
jgi:hypothetical protein